MKKIPLIIGLFCFSLSSPQLGGGWTWNTPDNVIPSMREDFDKEVAAYRQQVGNGMTLQERILALDRIIGNYKPLGLNVIEQETERSRLILQDKQQQLRASQMQGEANLLYDRGVAEYRDGQFVTAQATFQEAERLLPEDNSIKELRRKLQSVTAVVESQPGVDKVSALIRLAVGRYLENDPKRALNALVYAAEQNSDVREIPRLRQVIETNHPEVETPRLAKGISLIEHKLQQSLEAIYDGRYLTAISECNDVLDLEPNNVLGLTRLGSAYYAMNEKEKATQIWVRALQLDPENKVIKKFLYGQKNSSRVESSR